jgi:hypothetical protein
MLCQLVCVDRRYQRMNCFNIRELQGILKRKFFTDLINTSDSHKLMEPTLLNIRHKNNMSNILLYDQSLFYNFDLTNTSKFKKYTFNPGKIYTYNNLINRNSSYNSKNFITLSKIPRINNNPIIQLLRDFMYYLHIPSLPTILTLSQNV